MLLTATIEKLPEAKAVVTLSGPMTLGMSLKLVDTQVQAAIAEGVTKMVIDMTSVDYVDSAGLGVMAYAYSKLNQKNGALRLCGVSPRILSVLQLTKTDTFLAIDASRNESLAALPV